MPGDAERSRHIIQNLLTRGKEPLPIAERRPTSELYEVQLANRVQGATHFGFRKASSRERAFRSAFFRSFAMPGWSRPLGIGFGLCIQRMTVAREILPDWASEGAEQRSTYRVCSAPLRPSPRFAGRSRADCSGALRVAPLVVGQRDDRVSVILGHPATARALTVAA